MRRFLPLQKQLRYRKRPWPKFPVVIAGRWRRAQQAHPRLLKHMKEVERAAAARSKVMP